MCDINETGFEVNISRFYINLFEGEPSTSWTWVRVYDDGGGHSDSGQIAADYLNFEGNQLDVTFVGVPIGIYKYDMELSLQAERE
jgi:hypothetical protein